jgi:hypothetical protein
MAVVNDRTEDRTLLNFHWQATCADIMRRAVALMADREIAICDIVHHAVMIEDAVETLPATVEATKDCWRQASFDVLGFELDADASVSTHPDGYQNADGQPMWKLLMDLLQKAESTFDQADSL